MKKLNAVDVVRSRPSMYWGVDDPTCQQVNLAVTKQLELEGCKAIDVCEVQGWHVILSSTNWINAELSDDCDVKDMFLDAKGFPKAGGNSMRFEYFLYLLSCDLAVYVDGCLSAIKGNVDDGMLDGLGKAFDGKCCLFYKLPNIG